MGQVLGFAAQFAALLAAALLCSVGTVGLIRAIARLLSQQSSKRDREDDFFEAFAYPMGRFE